MKHRTSWTLFLDPHTDVLLKAVFDRWCQVFSTKPGHLYAEQLPHMSSFTAQDPQLYQVVTNPLPEELCYILQSMAPQITSSCKSSVLRSSPWELQRLSWLCSTGVMWLLILLIGLEQSLSGARACALLHNTSNLWCGSFFRRADKFSTTLCASVQGSATLQTGELLTSIKGLNQERGRLGLIMLKNVTCLRCHLPQLWGFVQFLEKNKRGLTGK